MKINVLEKIVESVGWQVPATSDASGVLTYKHKQLNLDLIVRSGFRYHDKRRDFYMVTFSDPSFVAWLVKDMREADYGYYVGGGLFMMIGLKLQLFLSDCVHLYPIKRDEIKISLIPFDFVHPNYFRH